MAPLPGALNREPGRGQGRRGASKVGAGLASRSAPGALQRCLALPAKEQSRRVRGGGAGRARRRRRRSHSRLTFVPAPAGHSRRRRCCCCCRCCCCGVVRRAAAAAVTGFTVQSSAPNFSPRWSLGARLPVWTPPNCGWRRFVHRRRRSGGVSASAGATSGAGGAAIGRAGRDVWWLQERREAIPGRGGSPSFSSPLSKGPPQSPPPPPLMCTLLHLRYCACHNSWPIESDCRQSKVTAAAGSCRRPV